MRVSDILKAKGAKVYFIIGDATLEVAVRKMAELGIGALPVLGQGERLLGVLAERDMVLALARFGPRALKLHVAQLVSAGFATVAPEDSVQHAMRLMTDERTRHIPVVSGGRIVGLLSIGDVVKSRLEEKTAEVVVLQDLVRLRRGA
jgi:CBS domain-containing protein